MNNTDLSNSMSFKDYLIGTLIRPGKTFELLIKDNRKLKFGFIALSINAFLYTLIYVFLTIGGRRTLII